MSYSRWINSYWYTFWKYSKDESYDTATFCICRFDGDINFTAKQLRKQFEKCIDTIKMKERKASEEEIDEVAGYMSKFLKDVEEEYGIKKRKT